MRREPGSWVGAMDESRSQAQTARPRHSAGEIDMLPAQKRYVLEHFSPDNPPLGAEIVHGLPEIDCVPVDDRADNQVPGERARFVQ